MDECFTLPQFDCLGQAFQALARAVLDHGAHSSTARAPAWELPGVGFTLTDPLARTIDQPARRTNYGFLVAETLWQLNGRSDVALLARFAPGIGRYGAPDGWFTGTAYGTRIFQASAGGRSQWERVRTTLSEDRNSRRAVLYLGSAAEDSSLANPDYTCTTSMQFRIWDELLELTVHMRSNDVMRGLQSDVFFATVLQELLARELGVQVGHYRHLVNYAQVYVADRKWAERCIQDKVASVGSFPVPERYRSAAELAGLIDRLLDPRMQADPNCAWERALQGAGS